MSLTTIHRALISVSDKTGIVDFARRLQRWNVEIISTGGTLRTLQEAGIKAKSISEITGFPEILDGRVKTLHPKIHGGLLAIMDNPSHQRQLEELDIEPIEMVVVNLYPFEQTISRGSVSLDDAVEQIDIGGPTMLRSAAKNFKYKTVIVNPKHYETLLNEMEQHQGAVAEETRFGLAKEVFLHTSRYDSVISTYLTSQNGKEGGSPLPEVFSLSLTKAEELRYGENPHQHAALYGDFHSIFQKLHGKELSYNNIVDIQAAAALIAEFDEPAVAIIKHTNPCGAGAGATLSEAYDKAFATDTKSAFGGIVIVNKTLDMDVAQRIDKVFTEVVIAPEYGSEVLEFLRKKKDRRLIKQTESLSSQNRLMVRDIAGGVLVQTPDDISLIADKVRAVTNRQPSKAEYDGMMFAWRVAKHVKSNAIVYARADRTIGIGAGQMSRFDSSRIAVTKAKEMKLDLHGTAVASDAFFPFADGLLEAVSAGATAVIQPGGSIRDEEVIKAADENNIAMVFTGVRHFKH
ncbi:MAG TPA: bifunctional phosphoribosylaminoimidazolecarboxamide formyltransferase/IMP cyclohydrolase [Bacteroidota bacterium]|jgi:phosphoribosylaminoimidazolecarboxamide formyltransferase/IMP cyclohydrolase|nr:bifunctional phosphoribosylaminoimidazolecarboxamide formyltransferase/IMP cyclohydrolase [Bacteroidota bacterium]